MTVFAIVAVVRFTKWFLDPYFKYKSRKQVKDYEIYENGKCHTKKDLGTPFLLREGSKLNVDLVGLGLVVPSYNE